MSLLGHSAGGHLALWAAGRPNLPAGARARSTDRRACVRDGSSRWPGSPISRTAYRRWHGGVVRDLMGGSPEEVPERYAAGDPIRLLPLEIPALIVHGVRDETVSIELSRGYAEAARAAGGEVELVEIQARPVATARTSTRAARPGRRSSSAWRIPTAPVPAAARAAAGHL